MLLFHCTTVLGCVHVVADAHLVHVFSWLDPACSIICQAKLPNTWSVQLSKLSVTYYCKLNVFHYWTVGQTKQAASLFFDIHLNILYDILQH